MTKDVQVRDIDHGWAALKRELFSIANIPEVAAVGIQGAEALAEHGEGGITNVLLGAVHEHGSPSKSIPQRSFLRAAVDEKRQQYAQLTTKLVDKVATLQLSVRQALDLLGARVKADVQNRIKKGIEPANKPKTIQRKGSSKPLIDTGQLVNSITWEVRREPQGRGNGQ